MKESLHSRPNGNPCIFHYAPLLPSYDEHEKDGAEKISEAGIQCP